MIIINSNLTIKIVIMNVLGLNPLDVPTILSIFSSLFYIPTSMGIFYLNCKEIKCPMLTCR